MKKIIIKYLIRYLFGKHLFKIVDICVYLENLENICKKDNNIKICCLDIAILRKWLCDNIIIYLDKLCYDAHNENIKHNIISHIDNDRYTIDYYINFVEKYKKGLIKIDDISKL